MKKLLLIAFVLLPMAAMAEEAPKDNKFNLNIRRIGFDWTKTTIKNAAEYQNSTVAALKATDQENIKGVFDTSLEYGFERFRWDNSLFMEYGKQSITPYNGERTVDESADKILLSTDLAYLASTLYKCIALDLLFILITFFAYLWVDDIEAKANNIKSIDNSLDWFWKEI